jgi:gliding motility-associated-like protein
MKTQTPSYYYLMMRSLYLFFGLFVPMLAWGGPVPDPVVAMGVVVQPGNVSCSGMNDGSFQITLVSNGGFVIYEWSSLAPDTLSGIGTLSGNSPSDLLDSLPPGEYLFKIMNLNGNDTIFGASIVEPPPLSGAIDVLSDYSGYAVACIEGAGTGKVRALVSGGNQNYTYLWSTGATGPVVLNLPPGQHEVHISDVNGCSLQLTFALDAPPPVSAEVAAKAEFCLGQHSGVVNVLSVGGGVGPYEMTLEGTSITGNTAAWDSLAPGFYTVEITDANGCTIEKEVEVAIGPEFEFSAGQDTSIFSGDTLSLHISSDRVLASIVWSPEAGVFEDTITGNTLLFPYSNTEYQIWVRDENGCQSIETFQLNVHKNRALYFPNVFAPEGNNVENQFFSIYGDAGVRSVVSLRIFDRWGRLWFDRNGFPVNAPSAGWHGDANGEKAEPGVYFWQAEVLFSDERKEMYQGDVTLIR